MCLYEDELRVLWKEAKARQAWEIERTIELKHKEGE
jgi:hypothetical protein